MDNEKSNVQEIIEKLTQKTKEDKITWKYEGFSDLDNFYKYNQGGDEGFWFSYYVAKPARWFSSGTKASFSLKYDYQMVANTNEYQKELELLLIEIQSQRDRICENDNKEKKQKRKNWLAALNKSLDNG